MRGTSIRYCSLCVVLSLLAAAALGCSKKKAATIPSQAERGAEVSAAAADKQTSGVTVDGDGGGAAEAGSFRPIYFEFDSAELLPAARQELQTLAAWLRRAAVATVTIEGHADQRGTAEYNVGLGERRAHAIREYLVQLGVTAARLSTISFGEERPAMAGDGEASWARNRRGELVVGQR
jgi:peptidoglycan-associated lipoprotein